MRWSKSSGAQRYHDINDASGSVPAEADCSPIREDASAANALWRSPMAADDASLVALVDELYDLGPRGAHALTIVPMSTPVADSIAAVHNLTYGEITTLCHLVCRYCLLDCKNAQRRKVGSHSHCTLTPPAASLPLVGRGFPRTSPCIVPVLDQGFCAVYHFCMEFRQI